MSTAEQQREVEVVVGTVSGITSKGPDKWTIAVSPDGSQYSRNLWTKDVGLSQALPNYVGRRLAFTCGVSHWTNQQNQPVRSLWINEVSEAPPEGALATIGQQGVPQQVLQQAQPQPAPVVQLPPPSAPTQQPVATAPADDRETMIMRQTAAKCAVWTLPTLPVEERTFPHLVLVAEGWYAYFTRGRDAVPNLPAAGEVQGTGAPQLPGMPAPGFTDPDDIPF